MLDVAARLALDDVGYLLPVAAEHTWYHGRYFDAVEVNEPHVSWALEAIDGAIALATEAGLQRARRLDPDRGREGHRNAFAAAGADMTFEELDDREHLVSDHAVAGLRRLLTAH